jgi:NTP pyrophosphatase (non-canonical NTP hydrolase)
MKADEKFSNDLSESQIERLAILAEECGEVVQIVGKILRHGYKCYNPTVPVMQQKPNFALLEKELGDLIWAISKLDDAADINFPIPRTSVELNMWIRRKENSAAPYLHHQAMNERSQPAALQERVEAILTRYDVVNARQISEEIDAEIPEMKQPAPAAEPPGSWPVYDAHVIGPSAEPAAARDVVSECVNAAYDASDATVIDHTGMLAALRHYDKWLRDELGVDTFAAIRVRATTTRLLG